MLPKMNLRIVPSMQRYALGSCEEFLKELSTSKPSPAIVASLRLMADERWIRATTDVEGAVEELRVESWVLEHPRKVYDT